MMKLDYTTTGYGTIAQRYSGLNVISKAWDLVLKYSNYQKVYTRVITMTDLLGNTTDFNGNLTRFTDRKGQVSQFTYDELNHRTQSSYADGSSTAFTYDAVSRLVQVNDSVSGLIQMNYDTVDRLAQEVTPQGTVTYMYDAIGRRTSMTVNGLTPVTYQYDNSSRLTQVSQGPRAVNLGYDVAGRRTSLTYPNGTATNYFYDNASRLSEILHQGPNGVIEDLLYTYDAAGNRISFERTSPQADLPEAIQAAYNAANQTTQFNTDTLTYDANGNLTSDGSTTYTWDARNRLIQMSSGSLFATFTYDALERRISKTINGATTRYLYDGNDIVAEIQNNTVKATYLRSLNIDEPFLRSSAVAEHYHSDALGSTLALTDATGAVQTTYSYDPFGQTTVTGTSSNPFQYTGRENDGTGVYYYRARYYSPNLQRFMSEDPLSITTAQFMQQDTRTSTVGRILAYSFTRNPKSLNQFTYVNNVPLNFTDPLGLINILAGAGGSAVAPTGAEASGGVVINPGLFGQQADIGVFGSIGAGGGLNVSGDVFIGYIEGDIGNVSGPTGNINVTAGPISVTVFTDLSTGRVVGGTIGLGPGATPLGASGTYSLTGTLTLRDLLHLLSGRKNK